MLENAIKKLNAHAAKEPIEPAECTWLLLDATPEAIAKHFKKKTRAAGLFSDEGTRILNGRALGNQGLINDVWSGGDIRVERTDSESFVVKEPRLTISTMTQYGAFQKFLRRGGEDSAKGNGLTARWLISQPISLKGYRPIDSIQAMDLSELSVFEDRMTALLKESSTKNARQDAKRQMLEFSGDAKVTWKDFANYVEYNLAPGRPFSGISDAASKAAENVARIAALFHKYLDRKGEIQRDNVQSACDIVLWFLHQSLQIFGNASQIPQHELDAVALDAWFRRVYPMRGSLIKRNEVMHFAPAPLRNKTRLSMAIDVLVYAGRINVQIESKTRTCYLEHFTQSYPYQIVTV